MSAKRASQWKSQIPSYEEYQIGREKSDLDVRLDHVKHCVRQRPEAAIAPQKIDHWDTVFQY